jgi:general secretion pathway protein C
MALPTQNFWFSRTTTFTIGAVAAASAFFWAFQWMSFSKNMPSVSVESQQVIVADGIAVARAFGAVDPQSASATANAAASSRFVLAGVLGHSGKDGAALIAVDGKPARPFPIGTSVTSEWALRSVQPRRAVLVSGFNEMVIEMPALPGALIAGITAPSH